MRLIDADALINTLNEGKIKFNADINYIILNAPTVEAERVVRCKDCRWFDKKTEHSSYGYCYAMRHGYLSKNWEITIYRTQKEDFYCADGEVNDEAN